MKMRDYTMQCLFYWYFRLIETNEGNGTCDIIAFYWKYISPWSLRTDDECEKCVNLLFACCGLRPFRCHTHIFFINSNGNGTMENYRVDEMGFQYFSHVQKIGCNWEIQIELCCLVAIAAHIVETPVNISVLLIALELIFKHMIVLSRRWAQHVRNVHRK